MIKEELEKEAEEWRSKNWIPYDFYDTECNVYNDDIKGDLIIAYLAGAEPREKQIEIDAKQIRALQKQNGELTDKLNESKNQIQILTNSLTEVCEVNKQLEDENNRLKGDLELWESGGCRKTNLDKCGVVKELKAQIEKMKRHSNCKHRSEYNEFDPYSKVCQSCCNLEKWEFGEIREK